MSAPIRVLSVGEGSGSGGSDVPDLAREDDRIEVVSATSARDGLNVLDGERIDCVVSGYDLPDVDGLEFLREIRRTHGDLPFVLFTDEGSEAIASEAISAGVTDYVPGRAGSNRLSDRIRDAVDRSRSGRGSERPPARTEDGGSTEEAPDASLGGPVSEPFVEREARERKLEALHDATQAFMGADGRTEIAKQAVETARTVLEMPINACWLYDDEDVLRPAAVTDEARDLIGEPPTYAGGDSLSWKAFERDTVEIRGDLAAVPERYNPETPIGSEVALPLGDHGVMNVGSTERGAFDEVDVSLARMLAAAAESALVRAERERELQRERDRFRTVFEQAFDAIVIADDDGCYVDANPAACELFGLPREELVGRSIAEFAADGFDFDEEWGQFQETDAEYGEFTLVRPDGTERIVEYGASSDIAPGRHMSVLRDVTEQKERKRERRALLEHSSDAIAVLDEHGTIRYQSPSVERLMGYSPAAMVGDNCLEYVHPDDRERVYETFESLVRGPEEATGRVEYRFRHADGSWRWVESVGSAHARDVVDGFVINTRDVTGQRRMREEIHRSNEALSELYGITTDTELTFDEKLTRILEVGRDRLGLSYGFLTRIDVDDGEPGDVDGTQTIVEARGSHELLQPGASCPLSEAYCRRTLRSDGLVGLYDVAEEGGDDDPGYERFGLGSYIGGKVVIEDGLYGTLCFADRESRDRPFTDTERTIVRLMSKWTSYELERRRTTNELRRQNDRLEEFAEVVSHDLRNPLTVLQGSIELAEETGDPARFANCRRAAERMERLIDELLTMARQGDAVADLEVVDLATLADDCWRTVDTPEATLEVAVGSETALWADRNRTRQILENLFRNAVEHGGDDVSVRVGELEDGDGFYVEDDGPGIPPDERDRVFESGYTTATDGTGLGLNIVEGIVEAHGWEIAATEGTKGGARFEITGVELL